MGSDLGKYKTITPKARHVFECLKIVDECATENLRAKQMMIHLKENKPFQRIIMWNFLPHIESVLPVGPAPYTKNEDDGEHVKLWEYLDTFPYYVKSAKTKRMNPLKIEQIFIGMLEVLPAEESEIIILAKDKKLKEKYSWLNNSFMKKFGGQFSSLSNDNAEDNKIQSESSLSNDNVEKEMKIQSESSFESTEKEMKILTTEELANSVINDIQNMPEKEKTENVKPKRKRRSKAEMETVRAAEKEEKELDAEAEEKIKSATPEPIKKDLDSTPLD